MAGLVLVETVGGSALLQHVLRSIWELLHAVTRGPDPQLQAVPLSTGKSPRFLGVDAQGLVFVWSHS